MEVQVDLEEGRTTEAQVLWEAEVDLEVGKTTETQVLLEAEAMGLEGAPPPPP
jgi:hypothetical protein